MNHCQILSMSMSFSEEYKLKKFYNFQDCSQGVKRKKGKRKGVANH
jgi:hypothetical protein